MQELVVVSQSTHTLTKTQIIPCSSRCSEQIYILISNEGWKLQGREWGGMQKGKSVYELGSWTVWKWQVGINWVPTRLSKLWRSPCLIPGGLARSEHIVNIWVAEVKKKQYIIRNCMVQAVISSKPFFLHYPEKPEMALKVLGKEAALASPVVVIIMGKTHVWAFQSRRKWLKEMTIPNYQEF